MLQERFATSHCDWIDGSAFMHSESEEINQQIVHYVNNSVDIRKRSNVICNCIDDRQYDCNMDELGPFYPGKTYTS